ncbi:MAG: hypothetical protein R3C08_05040 [Hyphomonas sp.]
MPLYELVPTGDGIFAFRAPEVNADAVMEFEVSASDGEDTTTETVAITATNIVLTPTSDLLGETLARFDGLNNPAGVGFYSMSFQQPEAGLIGVEDTEDGSGRTMFRFVNDMVNEGFGDKTQLGLDGSVAGEPVAFEGIYPSIFGAPYFPAFALEQSGKVYITTADAFFNPGATTANELAITDTLDVPGACAVDDIWLNTTQYDLIVGTRGNGLRFFTQKPRGGKVVSLTYEPGPVLSEDGEFCMLGRNGADIATAFDPSTSAIRVWKRDAGGFVEQASILVDVPDASPIVVRANINCDTNGHFIAAFLFTDGQHDGHHQLTFYYNRFDGSGPVMTRTYTWSKGVPTGLATGLVATDVGQYYQGYFVSLETVPYIISVMQSGYDYRGDVEPVYSEMTFSPAPLWSSDIRHGVSTDLSSYSLVLTQNRTGSVTMVELTPQP